MRQTTNYSNHFIASLKQLNLFKNATWMVLLVNAGDVFSCTTILFNQCLALPTWRYRKYLIIECRTQILLM